jgi:hypothetical protein
MISYQRYRKKKIEGYSGDAPNAARGITNLVCFPFIWSFVTLFFLRSSSISK